MFTLQDSVSVRMASFLLYDYISRGLISRWFYPLVPENEFDCLQENPSKYAQHNLRKCCTYIYYRYKTYISDFYSHQSQNVYLGDTVTRGKNTVIRQNVIVGENTVIGSNCDITDSVIGANCKIDDGVSITGWFIL